MVQLETPTQTQTHAHANTAQLRSRQGKRHAEHVPRIVCLCNIIHAGHGQVVFGRPTLYTLHTSMPRKCVPTMMLMLMITRSRSRSKHCFGEEEKKTQPQNGAGNVPITFFFPRDRTYESALAAPARTHALARNTFSLPACLPASIDGGSGLCCEM